MGRIQRTGAWISVIPSTVNKMALEAQERRDYFLLRYGIKSPELPDHCDGCGSALSTSHALNCKKGGLIKTRQNKLRDGVANLAGKAFTPTHVRDNPIIFTGYAVCGGEAKAKGKGTPPQDKGGLKGDLIIQYLWMQGMYIINNMSVVNTNTVS